MKRSSDMAKKILQISSLAIALVAGISISAYAGEFATSGNEEDLAAAHGSFTSDMTAPTNVPTARMERAWRHFAMRFNEDGHRMRPHFESQR
jgi:hypothetical protein